VHSFQGNQGVFQNEDDLYLAQQILIDLAKHLLEYADQVDEGLRDNYYDCLLQIINREELDLGYMGFDSEDKKVHKSELRKVDIQKLDLKNQNIYKKLRVCLSYQNFLYQTTELVLQKIVDRAQNEKEKQFLNNFIALAYFRIPEFRQAFLGCLLSSQNYQKDIHEWQEVAEQTDGQVDVKMKYFLSLFNWQKDFYGPLEGQLRNEEHKEFLKTVLEKKDWQNKFSKIGLAYFSFVSEWCQYINNLTQKNKMNFFWENIPGYNIIMRAFLLELKYREVKYFADKLKEASQKIIYNPSHLQVLLSIIYRKTKYISILKKYIYIFFF
jgi:hypothetical protein